LDPNSTALQDFLLSGRACVRHPADRQRLEALLTRWALAWKSKDRVMDLTHSTHGVFLHFNQFISERWCQVCYFHASNKHGVSMRGPDPDRVRKSHKYRRDKLDTTKLDALFEAWSAHGEAHPAGLAVEFFLEETSDDVWTACLKSVKEILG
jgi:hypothetical protein